MKHNRGLFGTAIVALACLLASCGGGGSGGGGSGGSNTTTPPPPPPPPPPTPPPPNYTIFTTSLGMPLIGLGYFQAPPRRPLAGDEPVILTNRQGQFGRGVIGAIFSGMRNGVVPEGPTHTIRVAAIDPGTGFFWGLSSPIGGTTVSPLTTVIDGSGDAASVARALRLFGEPNPLAAGRNLITFDAGSGRSSSDRVVARDAARLTSINLQLLGVGILLSTGFGRDSSEADIYLLEEGLVEFGQHIALTGHGDLRSATEMEELLRTVNFGTRSDEVIGTVAELLADYAAAVPTLVDDIDTASRFEIGLIFDIMPTVSRLLRGQGADIIPTVRARTPATIAADFAVYSNVPRQFADELVVAGPDYREVAAGGELVLKQNNGGERRLRPVWSNDWTFNNNISISGLANPVIENIAVAPEDVNRISVTLTADGDLRIVALPGFRGLASFDYRVRDGRGSAIGRAFVRVY